MSVRNVLWTLFLGLISGLLISVYFLGLLRLNEQLALHPGLVLLLPLAFLVVVFVRRHSDFFPQSFKEMREAADSETKTWSRWVLPLNLLLSWLSHAVGASLGRESTAIVLPTAVIKIFKLDWSFWRPIVLSASFAMATGYPIIALIIIIELFFSNAQQKFLTVLCAWVGCLVMKTLAIPPLFSHDHYSTDNKSFFSALLLALAIGIICGYFGRFYKTTIEWLKKKTEHQRTRLQIFTSFIIALAVTAAIVKFDLSIYESLSLPQFALIQSGKISYDFILIKTLLTTLCVTLGFIGGEFVPSLLIGSAIGVVLTPAFSENTGFGFAMGVFALFAAISKMKWTAVCLVWAYFDVSTAMWAYFAISLSDSLSGDRKLF